MQLTRSDLCLYIAICSEISSAEEIIGDGDIDYAAVMEAFRQAGYQGMYALECPGIRTIEEANRILDRIISGKDVG